MAPFVTLADYQGNGKPGKAGKKAPKHKGMGRGQVLKTGKQVGKKRKIEAADEEFTLARVDEAETTDEDADPIDEVDTELADDLMEIEGPDGSISVHKKNTIKTIEELERDITGSKGFAENTRRGSTRFALAIRKASLDAMNPTEGETELNCFHDPNVDKNMKGVGFTQDNNGDYLHYVVRINGKDRDRYRKMTEAEIAKRDAVQEVFEQERKSKAAEKDIAGTTRSGKYRGGHKLGGD